MQISPWIGAALVVALVAGAVLIQIRGTRKRARLDRRLNPARRERVQVLLDLPQKAQFELVRFYEQRSQTRALDLSDPAIAMLIEKGILLDAGAADNGFRHVTVAAEFWGVMKHWLTVETRQTIRGSHQHRDEDSEADDQAR